MAKIGSPFFYAKDLLAKSTAAAPSVTCELFPAVVVPFFLKAGLSLARPYIVVCPLIPSSSVIVTYLALPYLSSTCVFTGIISPTIIQFYYF